MKSAFGVIVAFLISCRAACSAEQSYSSGYEPPLPSPFPTAYKDYQALPGTFSPDQKYALIYPKRSLPYDLPKYELFLVTIKPFQILSKIPLGDSNFSSARCYYAVNWAPDSSAVVVIAATRWGPEKVTVAALSEGKVAKQTELTTQVRKEVLPDFKKSHAKPYNEFRDFVFDSEDRSERDNWGEVTKEHGWDIDDHGHVVIDCTCTTDPKGEEPDRWTVLFQGTWDIAREVFTNKKLTRVRAPH